MDPLRSNSTASASAAMPDMSLGLGHSHGLVSEGLHRGGTLVAKPSWGNLVQDNSHTFLNLSTGLRKRRFSSDSHQLSASMDASILSCDGGTMILGLGNSSASPSCASESSGGSGRHSSAGSAVFMTSGEEEEEDSSMDLGLGLTAPSTSTGGGKSVLTSTATGGGKSALNSAGSGFRPYTKRNRNSVAGTNVYIGLCPTQPQLKANGSDSQSLKEFPNHSFLENDSEVQLQLGLSRSSTVTADAGNLSCSSPDTSLGFGHPGGRNETGSIDPIPLVDEGSTSARNIKSGGYIPSLLMGRRVANVPAFNGQIEKNQSQGLAEFSFQAGQGDLMLGFGNNDASETDLFKIPTMHGTKTSTASTDKAPKTCKFKGCGKGARGASGLCITHGGGRRCEREGCNKGAEGRTVYCKSHGGGRRCQTLGCTKSAEGKTDYCIAHGGGRRCSNDGCTKAARGRSGLCIRHGGGKRCQMEGCTKSAEGYSGLCIAHGGGRRCQYEGCGKGAQGSTLFCKAHGGGKRCMIQGCNKGAEGSTPLCKGHGGGKRCMFDGGGICTKSVHGGTPFCVAHGGGKRCAIQGCTKSARGRTDFCVRHGGGKRCKYENCTKSAQGSTDFCKAHGGGKRCQWGQEGSPYIEYVKDKTGDLFKGPCDRFARGKLGLCAAHTALVQDRRVHGAGTIGSALPAGIGPGLFRGLVAGSVQKGNHLESASNISKQATQGGDEVGNMHMDHVLQHRGSDSFMQVSGNSVSSESKMGSREDESCNNISGMSRISLGYNPGIKYGGNNLDGFANDSHSLNKMNVGGKSNLWPGLFPAVPSKDSHMIHSGQGNLYFPGSAVGSNLPQVSVSRSESTLTRLFGSRPLLPPQVLVPPSMQKGDFFSLLHKGGTVISNASKETIFSMSLPEERVHGGSILALLTGNSHEQLEP